MCDEQSPTPTTKLPPQLVVANSAVLEEAIRHRLNPMRASNTDRAIGEQLRSTPSTWLSRFRKLLQI
jgi:hypothetical protein